ncbi:G patch domain-containing protein [Drosera capensis]
MVEPPNTNHPPFPNSDDDDDDDYMGDLSKFLPTSPSKPSKPQNPPRNDKPSKDSKTQKGVDDRRMSKERKQLAEDERTLANLGSAIPQSNIGFTLLKKMGYTPGLGLGKKVEGRVEPVGVEIRRTRAGIGREDPVKEKVRREKEMEEVKRKREEELMKEFGSRQKSRWRGWRVTGNYRKAKAVLDQLENRDDVVVEEEEGNDEEDSEEEEEEITEEDLQEILIKLRDEHLYCLFCGCQYESSEALLSNCPGINEDDH